MLRYMSKREKVREKIEIVRGGKECLRGRGREERGFFSSDNYERRENVE